MCVYGYMRKYEAEVSRTLRTNRVVCAAYVLSLILFSSFTFSVFLTALWFTRSISCELAFVSVSVRVCMRTLLDGNGRSSRRPKALHCS